MASATFKEVFPKTAVDAAAIGFVLSSIAQKHSTVLWVQDRLSRNETGRPYMNGLNAQVDVNVLYVEANRPADVMWAMEEGLRCKALAAVIGEVWGDAAALDFTATKRLAMRAEAKGINAWLIRRAGTAKLSAARERWRVGALPSAAHLHDAKAPGQPRWQVELFRSRAGKPGTWVARYDRAAYRLDLSAPLRDAAVAGEEAETIESASRYEAAG